MKVTLTTGLIALITTLILTCGGWVVSIAINANDQKYIKSDLLETQANLRTHCDKQYKSETDLVSVLSELKTEVKNIKEQNVRIERKLDRMR